MSLCGLMEYQNNELSDSLTQVTMKNYYTTQRYEKAFLKNQYHGDIALSELNYSLLLISNVI